MCSVAKRPSLGDEGQKSFMVSRPKRSPEVHKITIDKPSFCMSKDFHLGDDIEEHLDRLTVA